MPRRRSGKKIYFVHWTYGHRTFSAFAAGTAAVQIYPANHEPETLLRLRGRLDAFIDGASIPGWRANIGVGLILVPEGSSTTVTWSPITDGDAPWIWVDYFSLSYEEAVTDVIQSGLSNYSTPIDNKAMRIQRNQEVQMVVENVTTGSALSANITAQFRALTGQ